MIAMLPDFDTIQGFSLIQPWASLMALGEKRIETRSWRTPYRGWVAIAASVKRDPDGLEFASEEPCQSVLHAHGIDNPLRLPYGAIVCVGRLVDCVPTEYCDTLLSTLANRPSGRYESFFGNYQPNRFAWLFDDVTPLPRPIGVKGALGLYRLDERTRADLRRVLETGVA